MARNLPFRDCYYGFWLYYRIEHRKNGDALIISCRDDSAARPKIVCEQIVTSGKKLEKLLRQLPVDQTAGEGLLMALPDDVMAKFLCRWIGLDQSDSRERRKNTPGLTLALLLNADRQKLLYDTGNIRKDSTVHQDELILAKLIEMWGTTPWQDVNPQACSHRLYNHKERTKKDIKRIMLHFELLQLEAGIIRELTWESYDAKAHGRKRKPQKSLTKSQIEPTMLTDAQCSRILSAIDKRIQTGEATGIDMAVLLCMSTGLTPSYISALNIGDFSYLSDYKNRLTVNITREAHKDTGKSNYQYREIQDPYLNRRLPLPTIAARCYEAIKAKYPNSDMPLVFSTRNHSHRLNPENLKAAISDSLSATYLTPVTDVSGISLPDVLSALKTTALRELEKTGLDSEELRALQGDIPKLVSGRHYYDRTNESVLNKLGAAQDRWFSRVLPSAPQPPTNGDKLTGRDSLLTWNLLIPNQRTCVQIELSVPPIPDLKIPRGGITLELSASHGITVTIKKEYNHV